MLEAVFVFMFGAVIGSFLNVCIYRMPLEQSIIKPGSHCPKCKKNIAWFDNIPFIGFLILGGKCRYCKEKISIRYFIVELLTAVFFVIFYRCFGLSFDFMLYTILFCGLAVASFIDIPHRIIPDEISVGGIVVGLALNALKGVHLNPFAYNFKPVAGSFLGIIAGGGIIYLTGKIFDLVYFKLLKNPPIQGETESMGGGDVKLLAMIGAFLGWEKAILTFFIAPFFGAVVGLISLLVKKDHTVPYGPFLSLAAIMAIFWHEKILSLLIIH